MPGKILVVDDVATNRIVFKVKLGAACYVPILAANGSDCLTLARERQPDLILLDMNLPDIGAPQILRSLRADPATAAIPTVILSSETDPGRRMAAFAAGADDFLPKDVGDEEFLARLRNLLREYETIRGQETGMATMHALGFAESQMEFAPSGSVAIVTPRRESGMHLRHLLAPHLADRMTVLSREQALAEVGHDDGPIPDIFLLEADSQDPLGHLRHLSELRSRHVTRHSAICILMRDRDGLPAMCFDMGANDCIGAGTDPREIALRLTRIMARKRAADRVRASVRDGLRLALIDPLTGLHNRRYALSRLEGVAETARLTGGSFAVMVVDLDRFKSVNDHFGHAAGDAVLVETARRLGAGVRASDLVARIGGEEFLVVLPGADLMQAGPVAQRLCQSIKERDFELPGGARIGVTCSIGLATSDGSAVLPEGILGAGDIGCVIDRADRALLQAKTDGRDKVTISRDAA
ncbi:diguanylate cyclase [Szabonella alba]|uniref:diguanylate cyclase n=1 Tax=Szabonella alba TaxID=2804194 RepID=A0A8K0XZ35_9RHOB|nr:diguanylate cyclase [Szabonella alba]MBL4916381.1 diguanylate cyclase [Szabonella alba]